MKKNKKNTKVLFVSSEVYPFAKSGGLADVSFGLPKAMSSTFDISIMMPMYQSIDKERFGIKETDISFEVQLGKKIYFVKVFNTSYEGIECYFVDSHILSDKKSLYGTPANGYKDNDLRFGLFCKAVVAFVKHSSDGYDLLHLNDWQTALCALFVKEESMKIKTLFTIHNLAYQGIFGKKSLNRLGLSQKYFNMESLEFYDDISFMKAGIVYADAVTTVSPNYAKEILTPEFGCGLEGFLQKHSKKIVGILNGIDLLHFSPKTDSALVQNYDAKSYGKKAENKKAYLKERGLESDELPLFIFIGRFTWQKGVDLLVEVLQPISKMKLNLAILGDGESKYNQQIKAASSKCHNINLFFGYDESLSHRMYGAADFLLMPSQFEPCGLNQMICMHYGTLPIVHNVGGLKDSVHPISSYDSKKMYGFGIGFDEKNSGALLGAIKSALTLYEEKKRFQEINRHNMSCDFSWNQSAEAYATLYNSILDDMS